MADIDYAAWFRFALNSIGRPGKHHILELFAGHAPMAPIAMAYGHVNLALDIEPKMLEHATGARAAANALFLPLADGIFDLALATNASINYLPENAALAHHLSEIGRVLKPGAVYVFDCCTPGRAETLHLRSMRSATGEVEFSHQYDRVKGILQTLVTVSGRGSEEHNQRIFTEPEIRHAAKAVGLKAEQTVANYGLPVGTGVEPIVTWVLRRA
ncbi:class I SAM-dependent methyltransferase [Turneriella parva]|nr:methyltransferase domain-containing protein [Turneriella parva]